jgi:hypothetical protein
LDKRVSVLHGVIELIRQNVVLLVSLSTCALYIYATFNVPLWDLQVYLKAASRLRDNLDPYNPTDSLNYVYLPITTYILNFLNHINALFLTVIGLYIGSIAYFLSESLTFIGLSWRNFKFRECIFFLSILLGTSCFGYLGMFSGNIGMYFHFLIHAEILHNYRKNQSQLLLASLAFTIFLASLFKPYFLLYLISTALLFRRRFLLPSILIVSLFVLLNLLSMLIMPDQFAHFLRNLNSATLSNSDLGFGLVTLLLREHLTILALFIHIVILISVLIILWRKQELLELTSLVIPASFLAVLANPRVKEYDMAVGLLWLILLIAKRTTERDSRIALNIMVFSNFFILLFTIVTLDTFVTSHIYLLQLLSSFTVASLLLYLNRNIFVPR